MHEFVSGYFQERDGKSVWVHSYVRRWPHESKNVKLTDAEKAAFRKFLVHDIAEHERLAKAESDRADQRQKEMDDLPEDDPRRDRLKKLIEMDRDFSWSNRQAAANETKELDSLPTHTEPHKPR